MLSLLSILSIMTGCAPAIFDDSPIMFSNEGESDAKNASSNSLFSGESGLYWGVSGPMDEVTLLRDGEMTPNVTR